MGLINDLEVQGHMCRNHSGVRRATAAAALVAALGLPGAAGAQTLSIWTPLDSGTTDKITAIDYQGDTRFWLATDNGKLLRRAGGAFQAGSGPAAGTVFNDVEFQAAGDVGFAVGNGGHLWRSTDGGATWSQLTPPTVERDCDDPETEPVGDLYTVEFASDTVVYVLGSDKNVLKSSNATAPAPDFEEVNKTGNADDDCRTGDDFNGGQPFDAEFVNPTRGWLAGDRASGVYLWRTDDGLATRATLLPDVTKPIDSTAGPSDARLEIDPSDPNRMWLTTRSSQTHSYSEDGGATWQRMSLANAEQHQFEVPHALAFAGGSVLAAGLGGDLFTSADGKSLYHQPAPAPHATTDWFAADAYDATHGAAGGAGGALAVTDRLNTVPLPPPPGDTTAPTGSIAGPTSIVAGEPVKFRVEASDNAGGSGVDPAGFRWTLAGFPDKVTIEATYTFRRTGSFTLSASFRDRAGNIGQATLTVAVRASRATRNTKRRFRGVVFTLNSAADCVPAGTRMRARIRVEAAFLRRIRKVTFQIDRGRVVIDRRRPFDQRLSTAKLKSGRHRLTAKVYLKRLRVPVKLSTRFSIC